MGQFYYAWDNITLNAKKLWKLFLAGWPAANRLLDAQKNDRENFNLNVYKRSTSKCNTKMAKAGQFFKDLNIWEYHWGTYLQKSNGKRAKDNIIKQMSWCCVTCHYLSAGASNFSAFSHASGHHILSVQSQELQGAGLNSLEFALLHPTLFTSAVLQIWM